MKIPLSSVIATVRFHWFIFPWEKVCKHVCTSQLTS